MLFVVAWTATTSKRRCLRRLEEHNAGFALKVPFWRCLDLQSRIRARRRWRRVGDGVDGFFTSITLEKWERRIKVAIYRKRVFHETRKNYQLDLFDPDDGTWEYASEQPIGCCGRRTPCASRSSTAPDAWFGPKAG